MNETVNLTKIYFLPQTFSRSNSMLRDNILNLQEESDTKIHLKVPKENYGRWSKEEHQLFVEGIKRFGKNWKAIENHLKTRSRPQIRSHAQKFFKRLKTTLKKLHRKESYDDDVLKASLVNSIGFIYYQYVLKLLYIELAEINKRKNS